MSDKFNKPGNTNEKQNSIKNKVKICFLYKYDLVS